MKNLFLNEIINKIKTISNIPIWLRNYLSFQKQIKSIRKVLGISQKQLAERSNTTQAVIARIESGMHDPNVSTLTKIANALNSELKILIIPKTTIQNIVINQAEKKAAEIINFAVKNSSLEEQTPSNKTIKNQKQELIKELIEKKRKSLWD
jgi:predicted DNA-binding mobile mystery protein A